MYINLHSSLALDAIHHTQIYIINPYIVKMMSFFHFFVVCFSLLFLLFHAPSSTTSSSVLPLCNPRDNSNLLHFKNSFAIDNFYSLGSCSSNKTASWKNGTDCCDWDGVTCDTTSGHVIGLDLSCAMLVGPDFGEDDWQC
ncbi:hypothetical protein PIB30_116644 [Stylosanthes scabra]|uniref:Leucine-rich repeat-containing N-terminal plant-type domain-containing protein n=1 Tax=Stylosanthes scabra TaxID=79078 RepID=A0ABU6XSI6_9FABA|nr:hypothetical protein [Stylosanthes scabra]